MEFEPFLNIPLPSDGNLGFLSIASPHSFELNNKRWPTVEHYLLAKQFDGTLLEEQIRTAKTVAAARILARPKTNIVHEDGHTVKRVAYGTSKEYVSRADWRQLRTSYLEAALEAKFKQHPRLLKRLVATDGVKLVGEGGAIMGRIRDDAISHLQKPKPIDLKISEPKSDIKSATLTPEEKEFLARITASTFSEVGQKVGAVLEVRTVSIIVRWMEQVPWSYIVKNMPRYHQLIQSIKVTLPPTPESLKTAIFLAAIIRWIRMDAMETEKAGIFTKAAYVSVSRVVVYRFSEVRILKDEYGYSVDGFDFSRFENLKDGLDKLFLALPASLKTEMAYKIWTTERSNIVVDAIRIMRKIGEPVRGLFPAGKSKIASKYRDIAGGVAFARKTIAPTLSESFNRLDVANGWVDPNATFFDALENLRKFALAIDEGCNARTTLKFALTLLTPPALRKSIVDVEPIEELKTRYGEEANKIAAVYALSSHPDFKLYISIYGKKRARVIEKKEKIETMVEPTEHEEVAREIEEVRVEDSVPVKYSRVIQTENDIATFIPPNRGWLCVIANSTSIANPTGKKVTKSEAITRKIYETYPKANIYTAPERGGAYGLGSVITSLPSAGDQKRPKIASLVAEYGIGAPKKVTDTKENRRKWFLAAMEEMRGMLSRGESLVFSEDTLMDGYREFLDSYVAESEVDLYILVAETMVSADVPI